jgi:uncharacterized protein YceH (UPF0502 family)
MLRGTQTVGELRINSERLHRFADISAVDAFLRELAERTPQPLVEELARSPGERENRWTHLLSGHTVPASVPAAATEPHAENVVSLGEIASLKASVAELREQVAALQQSIAQLRAELGAAPDA